MKAEFLWDFLVRDLQLLYVTLADVSLRKQSVTMCFKKTRLCRSGKAEAAQLSAMLSAAESKSEAIKACAIEAVKPSASLGGTCLCLGRPRSGNAKQRSCKEGESKGPQCIRKNSGGEL